MKLNFVTIFVFLFANIHCEDGKDDVFVATSDWEEIKEGQKLPAGLHVRINLQTGKKEAKLPDEKSNKKQELIPTEEEKKEIPLHELGEALKKFKNDYKENLPDTKNFRTYEQLKKEMDALNLRPKLDSEIIQDLITDYKAGMEQQNVTVLLSILEDLEYLTHQIDNAVQFIDKNGLKDVIFRGLNVTDPNVKIASLKIVSSVMQNNPTAQIRGLQSGCIGELLKVLTLEKNIDVKNQGVAAISSILRRFPLAQKQFIDKGGLSVISNVFEEGHIKINVRMVTLLTDLVNEHRSSLDNDVALKQYEVIDLENKLLENDWCENFNKLLVTIVATDEDNHDLIEKCLKSMNIMNACERHYDIKMLNYLFQKYNRLGVEVIDEDAEDSLSSYFSELKDLCENLIKSQTLLQTKTEL